MRTVIISKTLCCQQLLKKEATALSLTLPSSGSGFACFPQPGFRMGPSIFRIVLLALCFCLLFTISMDHAMSAEKKQDPVLEQAYQTMVEGDSYLASTILQADVEPEVAAQRYKDMIRILCFQKKDVSRMVMIGRAGIQFALEQAEQMKTAEPKRAEELRGLAKQMAYNLAANCWPGWGDDGIVITKSDLMAGLDVAQLNLRLAKELKRNDEAFGNAHWVVGAHHLAAGKGTLAAQSFEASVAKFHAAGKPEFEAMSNGYWGLADQLDDTNRAAGVKRFNDALKQLGSEDAKFFAQQLKTAQGIFLKD